MRKLGLICLATVAALAMWWVWAGRDSRPEPVETVNPEPAATIERAPEPVQTEPVVQRTPLPDEPEPGVLPTASTGISVTVFDAETGAPIEGADVFDIQMVVSHPAKMARQPCATTDREGHFSIDPAETGALSLTVSAPGYCDSTWYCDAQVAPASPQIPMQKLGWIEGHVAGERGEDLAGARIRVVDQGRHLPGIELSANLKETCGLRGQASYVTSSPRGESDEAGRFRIGVVPGKDTYLVRVSHEDYAESSRSGVSVPSPLTPAWVDIALGRAAVIRGRVTYNGQPWSGRLLWRSGSDVGVENTGEDGEFEMTHVVPGEVILQVQDRMGTMRHEESVVVSAGQEFEHDIDWREELATISGHVRSVSGTPLEGLLVLVSRYAPEGYRSEREITDADGRFSATVEAGHAYTVRATRGPVEREMAGIPTGTDGLEFVMPEIARLQLRLVDAGTGGSIRLSRVQTGAFAWREAGADHFDHIRPELDDEGNAELDLPVGDVDLSIYMTALGYAPAEVRDVSVPFGRAGQLTIRLERGLDIAIQFEGEGDFYRAREDHLVFLLEESKLSYVRGPFPTQAPPCNIRVGLNMWFRDPGLLSRILDVNTEVKVSAVAPGRYAVRAFPDDLLFTPETFAISPEQRSVVVAWRER